MAASYSDMLQVSGDPTFVGRVRQSIIKAAINIASDGLVTPIDLKRHTQVGYIMTGPDAWKLLFAPAVASQAGVYNLATANGTVALTSGNVAAQAALVTDAAIDAAVSGVFNSFFGGQ